MVNVSHFIETLPAFQDLSPKERETLAVVLTPREVPQATDLFKQGEKATSFFIVADGKLVKRPYLITDTGQVLTGFKPEEWTVLLG